MAGGLLGPLLGLLTPPGRDEHRREASIDLALTLDVPSQDRDPR